MPPRCCRSPPRTPSPQSSPKSKEHEAPYPDLPPTPPHSPGWPSSTTASLTDLLPRPEAELRSKPGPSASDLPDDLIARILHCLPQDDPSCLLCASLVCKHWLRIVTDPNFLHHPGALFKAPPMLVFFDDNHYFTATTASAFSLPSAIPDCDKWRILDCRHGRVPFVSRVQPYVFLVWEPMTGERCLMPAPPKPSAYDFFGGPNAGVVCAVNGCDHRCCQGGPFFLVFMSNMEADCMDGVPRADLTVVCEYSSRTGKWGELMLFDIEGLVHNDGSILIGRTLYFRLTFDHILEFPLDGQGTTVVHWIPWEQIYDKSTCGNISLVVADDGELGIVGVDDKQSILSLWSREGGHGMWLCRRVMDLDLLLPCSGDDVSHFQERLLLGFAEETNAIVIDVDDGIFTIELKSEHVKKACQVDDSITIDMVLPLITFYTPGGVRLHVGGNAPSSAGNASLARGQVGDLPLGTIESQSQRSEDELGFLTNEARRKSSRAKKPNTKFLGSDWVNH